MENRVWQGVAASSGRALGRIFTAHREKNATDASLGHSPAERERFFRAVNAAKKELLSLADAAKETLGENEGEIFFIHSLFLEDEDFLAAAEGALAKTHTAEYALRVARDYGIAALLATKDDVMIARCDDLRDVSLRVGRHLSGASCAAYPDTPFLYFAEDVTPSEVLSLTKSACVGVILSSGALNSHAAILATAASLPMLVKSEIKEAPDGKEALLNCDQGLVILDPTPDEIAAFRHWQKDEERQKAALLSYRDRHFLYPSGRRLTLAANVGSLAEYEKAAAAGAEGIGLFRSEFLFLDAEAPPSEEEQFEVYKNAVLQTKNALCVIRVLDVGADKIPAFLALAPEKNPALGLRGVRLTDRFPALFRSQLRALLRASAYGDLVILFPMVISTDEVKTQKAQLRALKEELTAEGKAVGDYRLGVMIETPAAAILAKDFAKVADYFSIGTNDLFQYTLAIDRENEKVSHYADPHHDALLALIAHTVEAAHEGGIKVSLCGALAGDTALTKWLLSLQIDCLSLAPSKILPLKKTVADLLENTP